MSENFDDLLSGVVETAAGAAREPGAGAARKRGHQRRTRRRIAASTLSLAVLGVIGGVAATSLPGSAGSVPTAHSTSTATSAPSASASPSMSASAAASTASSTSASPNATGSSTQPAYTTPGSGTAAVHTGPTSPWLPATAVPLDSIYHWTWSTVPTAQYLGYVCSGNGTFAQLGATGVQARSAEQGIDASSPYYNTFIAQEQLYTFPSDQDAAQAFQTITNGAHACATSGSAGQTSPGVHVTATEPQAAAFAVYPTPATSKTFEGDVQEKHEYIAQHGSTIAVLDVTTGSASGEPSQLYLSDVHDQSVLASVAAALG